MSFVKKVSVSLTTDSSGDATAYSEEVNGLVGQVRYVKTDFANGVDFTVTDEATGATIWAESDVNASATRVPRQATHTTAGVAATYNGTAAVLDMIPVAGRIKVVVAQGGDTKTGVVHFAIV